MWLVAAFVRTRLIFRVTEKVQPRSTNAATIITEKHITHLSRHVEGGEERAERRQIKWDLRDRPIVRGVENFVFAPEAGEKQRHAGERHHADGVGRERDRHEFLQAAHAPDVLFLVAAVNDRARAHEQERLEKRVRDEVEHSDRDAADAEADHHVAELRNGGVGEHAFDVGLRDGDERGEDGGDGANPSDDLKRERARRRSWRAVSADHPAMRTNHRINGITCARRETRPPPPSSRRESAR